MQSGGFGTAAIRCRGMRLVAAVHTPGSETYYASETMRQESGRPLCTVTDLWEANKFLAELMAQDAI
ncbi:MAG: hypothetical protein NVS3B25_31700 [Hymenobacter sp.]